MKLMRIFWLAIALCSLTQAQAPLTLNLERFLVTQEEQEGKVIDVLSEAFESQPGQIIQETLTASNVSSDLLKQIGLVIPVPEGTSYLAQTANPLSLTNQIIIPEFSFDGGNNFAQPPLMKSVKLIEDGKEVEKEVEVLPEEYTHVRWLVPTLDSKEQISVSFRAMVR